MYVISCEIKRFFRCWKEFLKLISHFNVNQVTYNVCLFVQWNLNYFCKKNIFQPISATSGCENNSLWSQFPAISYEKFLKLKCGKKNENFFKCEFKSRLKMFSRFFWECIAKIEPFKMRHFRKIISTENNFAIFVNKKLHITFR